MAVRFGLDIGTNSVGSTWINSERSGEFTAGVSIFPAGVDESDDKRGAPKNVKRRTTRRARVTLSRRAGLKRDLRLRMIADGLLPADEAQFKKLLLDEPDPWILRRKGLREALTPHQFGRVLLHLAQRRGAVGFDAEMDDKGKVKSAMTRVQLEMLDQYGSAEAKCKGQELRVLIKSLTENGKKRTDQEDEQLENAYDQLQGLCRSLLQRDDVSFGRFIADRMDNLRTPITTRDRREEKRGPREWRKPVRNRRGESQYHADRSMIRDEFDKLWKAQSKAGGALHLLWIDKSETDRQKAIQDLRRKLDDNSRDSVWRHRGILFRQRKASWDLGTLGRCVLHPSDRCVPHADMHASHYRVVETVNNLKIIERGKEARSLTPEEREKIKTYLSGPLGMEKGRKKKGHTEPSPDRAKTSVSVTDLRELMGWGRATKTAPIRFNIESDEEKLINTDWFSREIIHGAVTPDVVFHSK